MPASASAPSEASDDLVAVELQRAAQRLADRLVVVDDEDAGWRGPGALAFTGPLCQPRPESVTESAPVRRTSAGRRPRRRGRRTRRRRGRRARAAGRAGAARTRSAQPSASGCGLGVGVEHPRQVRQPEERQHREVALAVPAVRGRVDHPGPAVGPHSTLPFHRSPCSRAGGSSGTSSASRADDAPRRPRRRRRSRRRGRAASFR